MSVDHISLMLIHSLCKSLDEKENPPQKEVTEILLDMRYMKKNHFIDYKHTGDEGDLSTNYLNSVGSFFLVFG